MINKPTVVIQSQLEWSYGHGETYRLVARPTEIGVDGIDYVVEELVGMDAMGVEIWKTPDFGCHSMVVAAFAQEILRQKDKNGSTNG